MATWNSRGLRGSNLEDMINTVNEIYKEKRLAVVQKIPTPITPVKIDNEKKHITLAYFDQKSTVDYIGAAQGIPICFDAKECAKETFPMMNIHKHQIEFMDSFEAQGGIAFLIVEFTSLNEIYYVPLKDVFKFYNRACNGGRKSFTYDEIDKSYRIRSEGPVRVHYLEMINKDIKDREE